MYGTTTHSAVSLYVACGVNLTESFVKKVMHFHIDKKLTHLTKFYLPTNKQKSCFKRIL